MRLRHGIKRILFFNLIGITNLISENLFAQDSSSTRWQIKYSASFNYFPFTSDNHIEISPASVQLEFFINKFGIYAGPKWFDMHNDESPYYPEPQSFSQRIGFAVGTEYLTYSFSEKIDMLLFYNFQYHYEIGHDSYDSMKTDNYYFENTAGAGVCFNISHRVNIALRYSLGNLRIKTKSGGSTQANDYTDHLVELFLGYNLK